MEVSIQKENKNYPIHFGHGILGNLSHYFTFSNKTIIITDYNIPDEYIENVKQNANDVIIYKIVPGETSKTIDVYLQICKLMLTTNFSRHDLVIALGGGVVGDLAGYVAATFKRGCRFINIPTSTLAMVDSSIGSKVAINVDDIKNSIGTFYDPEMVIIDFDTLKSLPLRQYNNGLVEALKTGLILDKELYNCFLQEELNIEEIIHKSLENKKRIVEADPFEKNQRKLLNFGHTIGHGIETLNIDHIYHGEAVAYGMLYFLAPNLQEEVKKIIEEKLLINLKFDLNIDDLMNIMLKDKKAKDNKITIVRVDNIGCGYLEEIDFDQLKKVVKGE